METVDLRELDKAFDMRPLFADGKFSFFPFIDVKKNKIGNMVDFGTLFLGWDNLTTDADREWVTELSGDETTTNVFHGEESWTPAHVAVALGVFPSVGQAVKNGWSKQKFEEGCHELIFKINKVRGSLWVHKIVAGE